MLKILSKAYRMGLAAGKAGAGEIDNPFNEQATDDNLRRGMGGSPWWDTKYRPFIMWQQGRSDAVYKRWLEVEKSELK
jgi:hypothetical protein